MVDLPPPSLPEPLAIPGVEPEVAQAAAPQIEAQKPAAADAKNAIQVAPNEEQPTTKADGAKRRNAFNALEIAAQIHQVQEWLTAGYRPNMIRSLCEEHWGLSSRVAETRMASARQQMIADANVYDRKEKVGQMLQQLELVLQQALDLRQGSNAIGALRLQADLLQLLSRQN